MRAVRTPLDTAPTRAADHLPEVQEPVLEPNEAAIKMKIALGAIELDASIQCRASIDTDVVGEYSERMMAGDTFPPIEVYGSKAKCWIGDGWHRTLAARQCGRETIPVNLHDGGRVDALKHALGANALHGHRRTNADKRRCVEIALREFPKLSSRAIAKMCGVSADFVARIRPELSSDDSSTRTSLDGKERPARRLGKGFVPGKDDPGDPEYVPSEPALKLGPPADGMDFARMAIMDLEQIRDDDVHRDAAFNHVVSWISSRRGNARAGRKAEAAVH